MPKVNSSVKANFPAGTPFGMGLFPDEAVAIGATTQAFLLQVTNDRAARWVSDPFHESRQACYGIVQFVVGSPSAAFKGLMSDFFHV